MQLAFNIGISACLFAVAAAGIGLAHATTRQLPFTLAATMSLAGYLAHGLCGNGWPLEVAVLVAVVAGAVASCLLDVAFIRRLDETGKEIWAAIAVSLGIYLVAQASLLVIFGEAGRTFQLTRESYALGNARLTGLQGAILAITLIVIGGLISFLAFTRYGRAIRGLASNRDLCVVLGIRTDRVRTLAVAIAGALTGLATVLVACDSGLVSSTGFMLFLTGVTAAILGGVGSGRGVAAGAVLLAIARHLVAYYGDPKWMDAFSFLILIGFLIWKPLGFSGRRLRKVEI